MRIIDTHTHLNDERFRDDIDEVIERARSCGVIRIYNTADSLSSFDDVLSLERRFPDICRAVLGIHPEFADESDELFNTAYRRIEENIDHISAIGEIGLDYHHDKSDETKRKQQRRFIEQIRLAKRLSLPIVIHSRDADFDTLNIIREEKPEVIDLHCFAGSYEIYREYLKLPIRTYIGIGGVVTFKNSRVIKEVVMRGDMSTFLTETDAPYLTPVPHRGERNEPSYLPYVIEMMSKLKGEDIERTAEILYHNGVAFYGRE